MWKRRKSPVCCILNVSWMTLPANVVYISRWITKAGFAKRVMSESCRRPQQQQPQRFVKSSAGQHRAKGAEEKKVTESSRPTASAIRKPQKKQLTAQGRLI